MRKLMKFESYSFELKLNENLLKRAWGKIEKYFADKFTDTDWWIYFMQYLIKKGVMKNAKIYLPKGGKINIPFNIDHEIDSYDFAPVSTEGMFSFSGEDTINEELVKLESSCDVIDMFPDEIVEKISRLWRQFVNEPTYGRPAIFVWGAPGIGKSDIIHQVADGLNLMILERTLAQLSPEDFIGIPRSELIPDGEGGKPGERWTVQDTPKFFPRTNGEKKGFNGGILFLDELNNATEKVLSASLSLIFEGTIPNSDYEMPSKWIVVAAGNRSEGGEANVEEIDSRLANRFAHVNLITDVERFQNWALSPASKKHGGKFWADVKGLDGDVIAFLDFQKEWLYKLDPDSGRMTWPSSRSWTLASAEYMYAKKEGGGRLDRKAIIKIFSARVGKEAASAFTSYLDLKDKFGVGSVKAVYEKGDKAGVSLPTRVDETGAAIMSIAFYKKGEKVTVKDMQNVFDYAMTFTNCDDTTRLLSFFKRVHPYVKTDEPYADIYQNYLEMWHEQKYEPTFLKEMDENEMDETDGGTPKKKTTKK